jgi:hypothetical protein
MEARESTLVSILIPLQEHSTAKRDPFRSGHSRGPRDRRMAIEPYDAADVQPSSVDLHVDPSRTFHNAGHPSIDVNRPMDDLTELAEISPEEASILDRGEFFLGSTKDTSVLPTILSPVSRESARSGALGCSFTQPSARLPRALPRCRTHWSWGGSSR